MNTILSIEAHKLSGLVCRVSHWLYTFPLMNSIPKLFLQFILHLTASLFTSLESFFSREPPV